MYTIQDNAFYEDMSFSKLEFKKFEDLQLFRMVTDNFEVHEVQTQESIEHLEDKCENCLLAKEELPNINNDDGLLLKFVRQPKKVFYKRIRRSLPTKIKLCSP